MEVQGSYGRQVQGISQQPPAVRLQGQGEYQLNTIPDVVDGLKHRPGTEQIRKLLETLDPRSSIHHYRRGDDVEEYFIVTQPNSTPVIFDKNGNQCVLNLANNAQNYISTSDPKKSLQFLTVADYTFVVNKNVTVSARPDKSAAVGNTAIIHCAYATYGKNYRIAVDNVTVASYDTPDGSDPSHVNHIRTNNVIAKLYESIIQSPHIQNNYNIGLDDTILVISAKDPNNTGFPVDTLDSAKGKDLVAIKYKISDTSLLPAKAPAGYMVQVWPTGSKPESRYWLVAEPKSVSGNNVTWKETIAADTLLGFDRNTMPYTFIRTDIVDGIAHFTLGHGEWNDRQCGDDNNNPMPSFVGQRIGGLFMVQNRLCLTSGEAVTMTRTSRFFNFFRPTVMSVLDTDPIDIYSDASEVYQLEHSVSLDGDTVVFSKTAQFLLPGDKVLTASNAVLRPTTTFENTTTVKPVVTGDSVIFAFDEGVYSGVREFYTDSYSDTKKAQPITNHVNRLIEGKVVSMTASTNFNRLFVMADKHRHRVYVYDWLWQGTERVQAAWHIWEFPEGSTVHGIFYSTDELYLIIERPGSGVMLERMDIGDPIETGNDDQLRMDRRFTCFMRYEEKAERWVSDELLWVPTDLSKLEAVINAGWGHEAYQGGSFIFDYDADNNVIYTKFDLGNTDESVEVTVGELYPVEFEPTPVLIKDNDDKVSYIDVPVLGSVYLNVDKAPDFEVLVKNLKTDRERVVRLTNRIGGARSNVGGRMAPREQQFRVPIRLKSTDVSYRIRVLSPHTFQLRDIEWEGSYNPSKKRV